MSAPPSRGEAVQKQIQQDWGNREYIEIITISIKKITDFLNSFDLSCRSKLAGLNEKLTILERKIDYLEACVTKACKNTISLQRRTLFHWINLQFNAVDEDRLKLVGPDRVCAEWILRNGGKVKWVNADEYQEDYNKLPKDEVQVRLQEIDATESSIMANGFEHLKNCKHLNKIILDKCNHMENEALKELHYVQDSLLCLQVSRCGNVMESGLLHLAKLQKLRTLIIFGLPYVTDRVKVLDALKSDMKQCKITYEQ